VSGAGRGPGRPRKADNLFLVGDIIIEYERLRQAGIGRTDAIRDIEARLRPRYKYNRETKAVSQTYIKEIIAEMQPESRPNQAFTVVRQGNRYSLIVRDRRQYGRRGHQKFRKKISFQ